MSGVDGWWRQFGRLPERALKRRIVFVVGAALSRSSEGGVANVSELTARAEERGEFKAKGKTDAARYQDAFHRLKDEESADDVDWVVRCGVLQACRLGESDERLQAAKAPGPRQGSACQKLQDLGGAWYLPNGVELVAEAIARVNAARANAPQGSTLPKPPLVITTNFDGLIEVALRERGIGVQCRHIVRDEFPQVWTDDVEIWHVHGYWCAAPTLHTPGQFTLKRTSLDSALQRAFCGAEVMVLAYGGWNDVVFTSMADVLEKAHFDQGEAPSVRWAFYQKDKQDAVDENGHVVQRFRNTTAMARVSFYTGVDAHAAPKDLMPVRAGEAPAPSLEEPRAEQVAPAPLPDASVPEAGAPTKTSGRTCVVGIKDFHELLNELVAVCPAQHQEKFRNYSQQAERNEEIDLLYFVADACVALRTEPNGIREFARKAADVVPRLASALARRMKEAGELRARLRRGQVLADHSCLQLPVVTYLFAEIIIAHAEQRERIEAAIHKDANRVASKQAAFMEVTTDAAHQNDTLLTLERSLWGILNPDEGDYKMKCDVSLEECERLKEQDDGSRCHEACNRVALHARLRAGALQGRRAQVFVEQYSEEAVRIVANGLKHVILVRFGGGALSRDERDNEGTLAELFKDFILLTHPHLGAP